MRSSVCIILCIILHTTFTATANHTLEYFKICTLSRSCNATNPTQIFDKKYCACDSQCFMYNDCCEDAPYRDTPSTEKFDCVLIEPTGTAGTYIKRTCSNNKASMYTKRCLSSMNYDEQTKNYKSKIPVTSLSTNITYGNMFCALCNNVTEYQFWNMSIACATHDKTLTVINNRRSVFDVADYTLVFVNSTKTWRMTIGNNSTEECALRPTIPKFKNNLRACYSDLVTNCTANETGTSAANKCSQYHSVVFDVNGTPYKNRYCAQCNNVSLANIYCTKTQPYRWRLPPSWLNVFLDSNNNSNSSNLYYNNGQTIFKINGPFIFASGKNATPNNTERENTIANEVRTYVHLRVKLNCYSFLQSVNVTKIKTETVHSPSLNRTYVKNKRTVNGDSIKVCIVNNQFEPYEPYEPTDFPETSEFTSAFYKLSINFAIFASSVLLVLHLRESTKVSKNTTEKMVVSYAAALLVGNAGFLMLNFANDNLCVLVGILTYYGFLASFFWLTAISFDISCKIWRTLHEFETLKNYKNIFPVYAILSWCLAGVLTVIMVIVTDVPYEFYQTCWFQNEESLLMFFVFPLTVSMSVNSAFYACTVYVACAEPSSTAKLSLKYGVEFKVHSGLVVITGLTWSVALMAGYLNSGCMWVLFAILNCFLGFLVYVSSPVKNNISKKVNGFLNKCTFVRNENKM